MAGVPRSCGTHRTRRAMRLPTLGPYTQPLRPRGCRQLPSLPLATCRQASIDRRRRPHGGPGLPLPSVAGEGPQATGRRAGGFPGPASQSHDASRTSLIACGGVGEYMDLCELVRVADRLCPPQDAQACTERAFHGPVAPSKGLGLLDLEVPGPPRPGSAGINRYTCLCLLACLPVRCDSATSTMRGSPKHPTTTSPNVSSPGLVSAPSPQPLSPCHAVLDTILGGRGALLNGCCNNQIACRV